MLGNMTTTQESREADGAIELSHCSEVGTLLQGGMLYGLSCAPGCGMGIGAR